MAKTAAAWVMEEVRRRYDLGLPRATVRLRVPADPTKDGIDVVAVPPAAVTLSVVEGGMKSRVPFGREAIAGGRRRRRGRRWRRTLASSTSCARCWTWTS